MSDGHGLGRRPSTPEEKGKYLSRYGLAADTVPDGPTPVVVGLPWYGNAYRPTIDGDGIAWLTAANLSGGVVGGHCLCLKPPGLVDPAGAWRHYDQGREGACVGFGWARASTLVEGRLFDAFSLYEAAKDVDEWPGDDYDGTSVRAGGESCRTQGLRLVRGGKAAARPSERWKIGAYYWAKGIEDVCAALHQDVNLGYLVYLQSWGEGHPHETRVELEIADRLIFREEGDAAIVVNAARRPGLAS